MATTSFGLSELSKDLISRVQLDKANFVTGELLVTESTKDNKRGHFGAQTLVGENGTFFSKFLKMIGYTQRQDPLQCSSDTLTAEKTQNLFLPDGEITVLTSLALFDHSCVRNAKLELENSVLYTIARDMLTLTGLLAWLKALTSSE
jgi:hypothetical protein